MAGQFKIPKVFLHGWRRGEKLWQTLRVYQGILALGASGILLLCVGIFLVWPLWQQQQILQQERQLKQQQLELWERFAKKNADYEGIVAQARHQQAVLRQQLPADLGNLASLTKLQTVAAQYHVVLAVKQQAPVKAPAVQNMQTRSIAIKAVGTYAASLSFLTALEKEGITGLEGLHLEADNRGVLTITGQYREYALK